MKKNIIYFLFLISNTLLSQSVQYGGNIGNWTNDWFVDMDICKDGKTVITTDANARYWSTFYGLYKIDNFGHVEWSFDFLRKKSGYQEYSIIQTTLDENDNIYSLIHFYQKNNPQIINGLTIYPGLNLFKISPEKNVLWIKSIKQDSISGNNILYKNGNIYVVGQYSGSFKFNETYKFTSKNYYQCFMWMNFVGEDYFIAKYDTTGNFIKATSFGDNYPDLSIDASIDKNGDIYLIGYTDGINCNTTYSSMFKFDCELNKIWEKTLSTQTNTNYMLYATNLFISNKNKIYVWGYVTKKFPVKTEEYFLENNSKSDYSSYLLEFNPDDGKFLRKLSTNTSSFQFTETSYMNFNKFSLSSGYMDDYGDNLLIHTVFSDTLSIGDSTIISKFRYDPYPYYFHYQDYILFSVNLNTFTPKLIKHYSGDFPDGYTYNDFPGRIKYNERENSLYISGSFADNPLRLFGSEIKNNSGNGCYDVFYSKINLNNSHTGLNNISSNNTIVLYPTPCDNFLKIISFEQIDKVQIYDLLGKSLGYKNVDNNYIDVSNLTSGTYIFIFYKYQKEICRKMILKKYEYPL